DKSLTAYITTEVQSEIVTRKSIEMCHALGFEVVAEGVETREMLELLYEMGCDEGQGYGISPPLPFAELLYWLRHQRPPARRCRGVLTDVAHVPPRLIQAALSVGRTSVRQSRATEPRCRTEVRPASHRDNEVFRAKDVCES